MKLLVCTYWWHIFCGFVSSNGLHVKVAIVVHDFVSFAMVSYHVPRKLLGYLGFRDLKLTYSFDHFGFLFFSVNAVIPTNKSAA